MKKLIYLLFAVTLWGCSWPKIDAVHPYPYHVRMAKKYPFRSGFPEKISHKEKVQIESVEDVCKKISKYLKDKDAYKNCHERAFGGYIDASALINPDPTPPGPNNTPVIQFIPCYDEKGPGDEDDEVFMGTHTSFVAGNNGTAICVPVPGEDYVRSSGNFIYNYDPDHTDPDDVQDFINSMIMFAAPPAAPVPHGQLEGFRTNFFRHYIYNNERTNVDMCTNFLTAELQDLLNQTDPVTGHCPIVGARFFFGFWSVPTNPLPPIHRPNKMRIILVAVLDDGRCLTQYSNGDAAVMLESGWPPDESRTQ